MRAGDTSSIVSPANLRSMDPCSAGDLLARLSAHAGRVFVHEHALAAGRQVGPALGEPPVNHREDAPECRQDFRVDSAAGGRLGGRLELVDDIAANLLELLPPEGAIAAHDA